MNKEEIETNIFEHISRKVPSFLLGKLDVVIPEIAEWHIKEIDKLKKG